MLYPALAQEQRQTPHTMQQSSPPDDPTTLTMLKRIPNPFDAYNRWLWSVIHRFDYMLAATTVTRIFPNGVHTPYYGLDISSSQIGPLASYGWGWTGWFGNLMFSQYLNSNLFQVQRPDNDSVRVQSGGYVDMGIGYTVLDVGRLRLTPVAAFGFGGIVVRDLKPNGYLYAGGELDATVGIPLSSEAYNQDLQTMNQYMIYVSCRVGYHEHYSAFDLKPTFGAVIGRLSVGIGVHAEKINVGAREEPDADSAQSRTPNK
jgi:hypothetical protein